MRRTLWIAATCILAFIMGCRQERPSPALAKSTFPAGNPIAGKKVFLEMRCWTCHEIYGRDMPAPVVKPAVPVYLGGNAIAPPDEVYLLEAIVAPSHELAPGWGREGLVSGGQSRMSDYAQVMTARQLFDLIAFLRSRYGARAEAAVRQQAGG